LWPRGSIDVPIALREAVYRGALFRDGTQMIDANLSKERKEKGGKNNNRKRAAA
jgi:hypothetical protein